MKKNNLHRHISRSFRIGNRLMTRAINDATCPLSTKKPEKEFVNWLEGLETQTIIQLKGRVYIPFPGPKIKGYFERAYTRGLDLALIEYHRPVTRGTDGMLYSASDMDDAMLYGR